MPQAGRGLRRFSKNRFQKCPKGAVNLRRILLTSALFSFERSNAKTTDRRRIVEHYRSAAAPTQEASLSGPWPTAGVRPCNADRDRVRAALGHPLEDVAARDGLRLRGDLLATVETPAATRGVEAPAPSAGVEASPSRAHRLLARRDRQLFRPRPGCWEKTVPNPTDRRRAGSKHHLLTDAQSITLSII